MQLVRADTKILGGNLINFKYCMLLNHRFLFICKPAFQICIRLTEKHMLIDFLIFQKYHRGHYWDLLLGGTVPATGFE